jgi:hypothetical protein
LRSDASPAGGTGQAEGQPTEEEFESVYREFGEIADIPRWSGRYAVLYENDQPHRIAFFGVSGD